MRPYRFGRMWERRNRFIVLVCHPVGMEYDVASRCNLITNACARSYVVLRSFYRSFDTDLVAHENEQ
jgi:hypothetical protein